MTKIPLIPFQRPMPQIFLKQTPALPTKKPVKATKKKDVAPMTTTKKPAAAAKPKFTAHNTSDVTTKPEKVQELWALIDKIDPGDIWVDDKVIITVDPNGATPAERTPKALKFTPVETALVQRYGIYDGAMADDQESAVGVVCTIYQVIEAAYAAGAEDAKAKFNSAVLAAADNDEDPEPESFDDDAVTPADVDADPDASDLDEIGEDPDSDDDGSDDDGDDDEDDKDDSHDDDDDDE